MCDDGHDNEVLVWCTGEEFIPAANKFGAGVFELFVGGVILDPAATAAEE